MTQRQVLSIQRQCWKKKFLRQRRKKVEKLQEQINELRDYQVDPERL